MAQRERGSRKSVAIVGEGLTEFRYMDALRTTERYHFKLVPGMPKHSDIDDMVNMAQKCVAEGYNYVICLVDMDVILSNASKLAHYKKLKKDNPRILFVESNACTEYWFLMHFMASPSSKEYATYESIVKDLRKHLPNYDKTEAYFTITYRFYVVFCCKCTKKATF